MIQTIGDLQREHVAIVTQMLCDVLVDISVHDFCLIGKGILNERVLGKEGNGKGTVDLICCCEVPCRCLMSTMFSLHEVPSIVGVCSKRPLFQIGLQRTASIESGVGMGVVLPEVEEAVDSTIKRSHKTVGQDAPLVVTLDKEEAAFVVCIGLCLVEVSVLTDVFFHVAMRIAAVIALQLRCKTRGGVGELQVVCHHSIGMYLGVSENGLHRVLFDADVAHEGNLRDVLGDLEVVL